MTRYEFFKKAGFTGASLWAAMACVKEEDTYIEAISGTADEVPTAGGTNPVVITGGNNNVPSTGGTTGTADKTKFKTTAELNSITNAKLKIDLTIAASKNLLNKGGYLVYNAASLVVALSPAGEYICATITCSHEPKRQIILSNGEWFCTAHDARFTLAGKGINKNGSKGLTIYKTITDGKTLIIY